MSAEPPVERSEDFVKRPLNDAARRARAKALQAFASYFAFSVLIGLVPLPHRHHHHHNLLMIVSVLVIPTVMFMYLQLWVVRSLVGLRTRGRYLIAGLGGGLLALIAFYYAASALVLHGGHRSTLALIVAVIVLSVCQNIARTVACASLGIMLSRIVREPNVLLPVALVAMPIDYMGAMTPMGFTSNMLKSHPNMVKATMVAMPAIGGIHPIAFIGPGDLIFIAFFLALTVRLKMNPQGTFWWMFALLTVAMLIVISPIDLDVAALIPMGLAAIIANARFFHFTRAEVFAMVYVCGLMLALAFSFYLYSHSHFFAHQGTHH